MALRFGVNPTELRNWNVLDTPDQILLAPGEPLRIASQADPGGSVAWLLPDSELVFSPGAMDFQVSELAVSWGGYLNEYRERVAGEWMYGPQVVAQAALDHSINPRLLLAILELRGGWVSNPEKPRGLPLSYPIWSGDGRLQGLYLQLSWAANELSHAYYGWREGSHLAVPLADGTDRMLAPDLNAATAAILHLSARFAGKDADPQPVATQLLSVYARFFGDPWQYEVPLYEAGATQPEMTLPFPAENPWVFTGGPHGAWGTEAAWAALDFAPKWDRRRRSSNKDVVALADGVVARLDTGVLVLDLDGDGFEQTGWSVLYLHVVPDESIGVGTALAKGQFIGIASEIGGVSQGLHVHIARKYNGEWVAADGPLPFNLSGWRVRAGPESYLGVLYREGSELLACPYASQTLLSVGGGEMFSPAGLPDNLRGCWSMPDSPDAPPLAAQTPDLTQAVDPLDAWMLAPDPGPLDLPPTRLISAPY